MSDYTIPFEEALARKDWDAARALVESQADPGAAFLRIWNNIALGEDSTEDFTIERLHAASHAAAERVRDAVLADHQGRQSCDNISPYLRDPAVGANMVDGRDMPWLAYHLVTYGCLTREEAHTVLARAWVSSEYPETTLGPEAWHVMFAYADGVVTDLTASERDEADSPLVPPSPLWLYRGAVERRACGMAWTADRDRAAWFARRWNGQLDETAIVWTALVEPHRILARFAHRNEDEYVIDTTGLTVEPLDDD